MDVSREKETKESVWTTGRMSVLENHKFVCLMQTAFQALLEGEHFKYEDPKIILETKIEGETGHVFYSWKFPPKQFWAKETKTKKECFNCLPAGINGEAAREAWCLHIYYNALKCPYGVPTPDKICPLEGSFWESFIGAYLGTVLGSLTVGIFPLEGRFWESFIGAYLGTVLGSLTVGLFGFFLIKFLFKRLSQDPEIIKWIRGLKRKVMNDED